MKWYVVNVYSGSEKRAQEQIYEKAKKNGLSDMFGEILIPSEEVIEIKKGEKVKSERKFFPGYILVHMTLTDETWHLVRSIPRVSDFLGGKGKPLPISGAEVARIIKKVEDSVNILQMGIVYEVGDAVMVCDGPFATFQGVVEEVEQDKERVKVSVSIFGRPTNVDLAFSQIEKVTS